MKVVIRFGVKKRPPHAMSARTEGENVLDDTQILVRVGAAGRSECGPVRAINQDCFAIDAQAKAFLVADGMGGHKAGEVASALAIDALRHALAEPYGGSTLAARLARAVERANSSIWQAALGDPDKEGMGTTLVCALLTEAGDVTIANVGDSRAYAIAQGRARLVTIDHTWVNQQVLGGQMSERDARHSPFRNLLTRSLGNTPEVDVDVFGDLRLENGDALVLVSDGVTGYLDERDLVTLLRESTTAQAAAERLVEEAVARGGADNATAVVVRRE
jgi:protein phosphatase